VDERLYAEYARIQDRHWWFVGRRRIVSAILEAELGPGPRPGRRIVDIGCGTGTNLDLLGEFGHVEGVDAERAAVEHCHRMGYRAVRHFTGSELPYPDASVDLITLMDVIEHVEDDHALLSEARRVLVPGGSVLVTVPAYTWMWGRQDEIAHHYRRYTRPRLLSALRRAGLQTDRSSYFNTLLFPPIAMVRLARRLASEPDSLRSDFELTKPGRVNSLLARVFGWEATLLPRMTMPFGVSILTLARRVDANDGPAIAAPP